MQAEEYDHEALVVKGKEGDADAIEEWLSSLGPGEFHRFTEVWTR